MKAFLGQFFESNIGAIVKRGLAAVGIGAISYAAVTAALDSLLLIAQTNYNNIGIDIINILNLAGFGDAFGIISGAIVGSVALSATSKLGLLPK